MRLAHSTLRHLGVPMAVLAVASGCREPSTRQATTAFENGRWFDGESFVEQTWYAEGTTLRASRPSAVDSVIDLAGRFVVPPYAEGHNHLLEWELIDTYIQMYLEKGIFYLKDQSNTPFSRSRVAPHLNTPTSLDFVSANQGFTGPGGHPIQIVLQLQQLGALPSEWTMEEIDGEVVFIVETLEDIEAKWPLLLEGEPDFIKIFLLYSEEHQRRVNDPDFMYRRGMDPALAALIVKRAHEAALEVSAHIYSAADFRTAVRACVDHIAHFPGLGFDHELGVDAFLIDDADAALAARNGVTVLTTIGESIRERGAEFLDFVIRPNLATLRRHDVTVVIGSDQFRRTAAFEVEALAEFEVFDNLELLTMWSVDTVDHTPYNLQRSLHA